MGQFEDLDEPARRHLEATAYVADTCAETAATVRNLSDDLDEALGGDAAPANLRAAMRTTMEALGGTMQDLAHRVRASNAHVAEIARAEKQQDQENGNAQ